MIETKDAVALIQGVFDQARQKAKPDWQFMNTSVLNNRLLGLTDRNFDPRMEQRICKICCAAWRSDEWSLQYP